MILFPFLHTRSLLKKDYSKRKIVLPGQTSVQKGGKTVLTVISAVILNVYPFLMIFVEVVLTSTHNLCF